MWFRWQQGYRGDTRNFISVHSSSRATSSPLQNFAKISLKTYTIKYNTKTQSWTLQDWSNPCIEPYYEMQNSTTMYNATYT